MSSRPRVSSFHLALVLIAGGLAFGPAAPAALASARPTGEGGDDLPHLQDAALEPFQVELLDLAFKIASAIPSFPHIKTRCSVQADVAAACIELGQFAHARTFIEQIGNWRRGEMYAQLAFRLAQRGEASAVKSLLDQAQQVAGSLRIEGEDGQPEGDGEELTDQAWRRDRILVQIARTHALLGDEKKAALFETGVVDSETGKVDGIRASRLAEGDFDARLASLEALLAGSDLDQARTALGVCAQLYDRFYADAERRARLQKVIEAFEHKLPGFLRIDQWIELAGYALDHGDLENALAIVNRAKQIAGACTEVRLVARLARLRYVVGDREKARVEADSAFAMYDEQRPEIIDIYRAGVLRPLAEAYQVMGDSTGALNVYARAVEEGIENPNSRPRAEDLAATCLSMARSGCEPDPDLKARIYQVFGGLGDPW